MAYHMRAPEKKEEGDIDVSIRELFFYLLALDVGLHDFFHLQENRGFFAPFHVEAQITV